MTKEELILILKDIRDNINDPEAGHPMADAALIEYIADADVENVWSEITRWYA